MEDSSVFGAMERFELSVRSSSGYSVTEGIGYQDILSILAPAITSVAALTPGACTMFEQTRLLQG